ncbi:MAG: energy transducer TonB [bacterium]
MFTTLVESRAVRRRSARGAATSILVHGAVIAVAVAMTMPGSVQARPEREHAMPTVIYRQVLPAAPQVPTTGHMDPSPVFSPRLPTIPAPTFVPPTLPPLDIGAPVLPPDQLLVGHPGASLHAAIGSEGNGAMVPGAAVDVADVERAPRLLGNALPPRYPTALRESGVAGRVVIRFVIDTLGRAEMDGLTVQEATHPLFAAAVAAVLGAYRFTPGEAGGRKVRTMVQLPFSFALRP